MEIDKKTIQKIRKKIAKMKIKQELTDERVNIILEMIRYSQNRRKPDYLLETELLKNAKIDLASAKKLYIDKLYSSSIFHLQQSTEKTAKAWGLYMGIITQKDLKKVSHKTPKIYQKLLDDKIGSHAYELLQSFNPDYMVNKDAFNYLFEKSSDILYISYEYINKIIEIIHRVNNTVNIELYKYKSIFEQKFLEELSIYTKALFSIYLLSIITFPHFETSRYPTFNKSGELLSSSFYTQDLGIVRSTDNIIALLDSSIDTLLKQIENIYINT